MNFFNVFICCLFLLFFINDKEDNHVMVEVPIPLISVFYDDEDDVINDFSVESNYLDSITIQRISAYNPVPRQTDSDPNVSSCGPTLEKQIAVSRDLFFDANGRKHLCGVRVKIITDRGEVFDDYVIWDTMAPRFSNTVDIMINNNNENEAYSFGVTSGVLIIYQ